MARRLLSRWTLLLAVCGPALLFQQGCLVDPDIAFRAVLQTFTEVGVFALDNLVVSIR